MLELKNITKTYVTSTEKVQALKGINLDFRKSEFVSILGQSGCGKTTLLNIIGGLDRYTTGDLIINGKSTKNFKDRDWDAYRNHSIGFVFQSYNLISHQSILSNVEMALTIGGVSKKDRKQRAIKALEDVGLKDHIHKKPNQLSGGQMQRVAIARALVNNPDIILADEPTGALDTKTSIQIMEILKEISKEKLIIMVTHNPELAQQYSTRIIKILDGIITDDSNPISSEELENEKMQIEPYRKKKFKRTSMSLFTAFKLSLNNLMTKKGRTILTSFAGSIGIIGIALILSISAGIQSYIDKVEEDTVSSYPIQIQDTSMDMGSMMGLMMGNTNTEGNEDGKIYSSDIMNEMMVTLSNKKSSNNLKALKEYIETTDNAIKSNSNAVEYSYDLKLNLYKNDTNTITKVNPSTVLNQVGMGNYTEEPDGDSIMNYTGSPNMAIASDSDVFIKLIDNQELLESQNILLAGKYPTSYNEVILMLDKNNQVSDYTLYSLGLKDQTELKEQMKQIKNGEEVKQSEKKEYSYDDFLNLSFKVLLNSDYYNKENGIWIDKSDDEDFLKKKLNDAEEIKIVGIVKQNNDSKTQSNGGIGYIKDLEEHVINKTNDSELAKDQKANPNKNVFTNLDFPKEGEDTKFDSSSLSVEQRMALAKMSPDDIAKMMQNYSDNASATYESNMNKIGAIDLSNPTEIDIYPKNFDSKDAIAKGIEEYNNKQKEDNKEQNVINYTDLVGIMMKSVSTIVNIISTVLIAFVAISLIVSSIMIAIITYISVLERIKEIGILRAIGASKKDISRIFNAETIIEGFFAGLIGVGITVLLTFPINSLILKITGTVVTTYLPLNAAIFLVLLSMILTTISGLIPAKMASKKDPVIALRSE